MKLQRTSIAAILFIVFVFAFVNAVLTVYAEGLPEALLQLTPIGPELIDKDTPEGNPRVVALYFYANDCPHCIAILNEVIYPLEEENQNQLEVRLLNIDYPEYYEALLTVEEHFELSVSQRSIPTLIIGKTILIGEDEIRDEFPDLVRFGISSGGLPLVEIPGIDLLALESIDPIKVEDESCETEGNCEIDAPIFVAYFYQTGCKECSRVSADLAYLRTKYPQLVLVEFNIFDHADLAAWMTARVDPSIDFQSPALFIGDFVLFGEEIIPENIIPILERYSDTGAEAHWLDFNANEDQATLLNRFSNMGWLAVVAAGLVDGINPCAFATLIFFVSYLTLSGRKGKEVLFVGGGFTLGVFIAYLAVGLGFYKLLEILGNTLNILADVVYIITGIFCLVLAGLSFWDSQKARNGNVGDMILKLPEPLRRRINETIRKGRKLRNYVLGAFVAGLLISFLELACTGQVYLPTIIFVSSMPGMRLQAILYLILYNLLFILPLVIIFVMVYFGTTSKDLTNFLRRNAAVVKFGMGIVFLSLGGWLVYSLFM